LRTIIGEAREVPVLWTRREETVIKTRPILLLAWLLSALLAGTSLLAPRPAAGAPRPADPSSPCPFPDPSVALRAAVSRLNHDGAGDDRFVLARTAIQGRWAYGVVDRRDRSGGIIPYQITVPLAVSDPTGRWCVLIPGFDLPEDYNRALDTFPTSLLDRATVAWLHQPEPVAGLENLSGYRLPWPGGQFATVTQRDGPYHQNQIDFDILGWSGNGAVVATRPGQVVFLKESSLSGCCDFSCWEQANMVVLQHADEEFSWYVHLAYDSVPVTLGQWVEFGALIGIEGNTGYSCGVHLHYMASSDHTAWTDPTDPDAAPWGLDIVPVDFDESPWLGLIPGLSYFSQNYPVAGHVYLPVTIRPPDSSP
jgi:murein DD-endopeptidase MepM/ murein hydrolase activator NlpD